MQKHRTNNTNTTVTSCTTLHNIRSKVSLLRHRTTGKIHLEGPLLEKWVPPESDTFPTPVAIPPSYVNKNGYFDSGTYRCSKNGVTYYRNGRSIEANPQLEFIDQVDYDHGFNILSLGHTESVDQLIQHIKRKC